MVLSCTCPKDGVANGIKGNTHDCTLCLRSGPVIRNGGSESPNFSKAQAFLLNGRQEPLAIVVSSETPGDWIGLDRGTCIAGAPTSNQPNSPPAFSNTCVPSSSPKLTIAISRKNSLRADRKTSLSPSTEIDVENINTANKQHKRGVPRYRILEFLTFSWSPNFYEQLPLAISSLASQAKVYMSGRKQGFKRTLAKPVRRLASIDPMHVLFFFAALSCTGTTILIYYTVLILRSQSCASELAPSWQ